MQKVSSISHCKTSVQGVANILIGIWYRVLKGIVYFVPVAVLVVALVHRNQSFFKDTTLIPSRPNLTFGITRSPYPNIVNVHKILLFASPCPDTTAKNLMLFPFYYIFRKSKV